MARDGNPVGVPAIPKSGALLVGQVPMEPRHDGHCLLPDPVSTPKASKTHHDLAMTLRDEVLFRPAARRGKLTL